MTRSLSTPKFSVGEYRFTFNCEGVDIVREGPLADHWRYLQSYAIQQLMPACCDERCSKCVFVDDCLKYDFYMPEQRGKERPLILPYSLWCDDFDVGGNGRQVFYLRLFGEKNNAKIKQLIAGWQHLGKSANLPNGFRRHTLQNLCLQQVEQRTDLADKKSWAALYQNGYWVGERVVTRLPTAPPVPESTTLLMLSPCSVRSYIDQRKTASGDPPRFAALHLFSALLNRYKSMEYLWGDPQLSRDTDWLKHELPMITFADNQLRDYPHNLEHRPAYSKRGTKIEYPIIGSAKIEFPISSAAWHLLWYGKWLQFGKWTNIGFGKYELLIPSLGDA
jgi:hypothetical protein